MHAEYTYSALVLRKKDLEKDTIPFLVPSAYRLSPYSLFINKRSFYFFTLYSESRIDFRRLDLQDDLWRYSWHRVWAWHRVILHLATWIHHNVISPWIATWYYNDGEINENAWWWNREAQGATYQVTHSSSFILFLSRRKRNV